MCVRFTWCRYRYSSGGCYCQTKDNSYAALSATIHAGPGQQHVENAENIRHTVASRRRLLACRTSSPADP